jgi:predicted ATPase/DNA-binding SARP family transcriptional activator/Tfp pilus assembly protein PilF
MTHLSLSLLGSFQAILDEKPLRFATRKSQALLAYLAVESGQPHEREALAGLLWPEHTEDAARHSLRLTLNRIPQVFRERHREGHGPILWVTPRTIQFNSDSGCTVDLTQFTAHIDVATRHLHRSPDICTVCSRHLQLAVDLYRGPFLKSLSVPDSPDFELWLLMIRERLHQQAIQALQQLTSYVVRHFDYPCAQRYAHRQLTLDPLQEPAHRQLMLSLALSGQRSAALAQYERCCRMLAEEFGAGPEAETQALYERIVSERLPVPQPPTLKNWPNLVTSFVGRETELAQIAERLQAREVRLLTLTGPGGIGKTRLALEAAAQEAVAFREGVCFVPLAAVTTKAFLVTTVADALGIPLSGTGNPRDELLSALRNQELLLVLDNMEHLLPDDGLLVDLLRECPALCILITSRERLKLAEEWVLPVEGFEIPDQTSQQSLEKLSAIQLVNDRARRADVGYRLAEEDQSCLLHICQLVGGMPLALEMIAGWLPGLPCAEIARQIQHSLELLAGDLQNIPERHRSIRAVLNYSWLLLTDAQRHLLRQLAVFSGGFDLDAAVAVLESASRANLSNPLAALVDKSLLQIGVSGRYTQHPLIWQYGVEKLEEFPELRSQLQGRHGRYFATFLKQREEELKSTRQIEALAEISLDIENIRAAWSWAVNQKRITEIRQSIMTLRTFYYRRGWHQEAITAMSRAVVVLESKDDPSTNSEQAIALGGALAHEAFFHWLVGESDRARQMIERALTILHPTGENAEFAQALQQLGGYYWRLGDYASAKQHYQRFLEVAQKLGIRGSISRAFTDLALISAATGAFDEAKRLFEEALAIAEEVGNISEIARLLNNISAVLLRLHDPAAAKPLLQRSLDLTRSINELTGVIYALSNLGRVALMLNQYSLAQQYFEESLALARDINNAQLTLESTYALGEVAMQQQHYSVAESHFCQSLRLSLEIQSYPYTVSVLLMLADVLLRQNTISATYAVEIVSAAIAHPAMEHSEREQGERLLKEYEAMISPHDFSAAKARAESRGFDMLIKEVLELFSVTES